MQHCGVGAVFLHVIGGSVIKTYPNTKNQITVMHGHVGFIGAMHAQHTYVVGVGAGKGAKAHQGVDHWNIQTLRQDRKSVV